MSEQERLKPCPFCGGRAEIFERGSERQVARSRYFYVNCLPCDCEGPPGLTKRVAWDAWNKRFQSPEEDRHG